MSLREKNIHFGEPQPEKVKEYTGYHQSAAEKLDRAAARVPDSSEWRTEAACRHRPPEVSYEQAVHMRDTVFFARPKQERKSIELAKSICMDCPVAEECLEYALVLHIEEGVWGGLTPAERRRARKKRDRIGE